MALAQGQARVALGSSGTRVLSAPHLSLSVFEDLQTRCKLQAKMRASESFPKRTRLGSSNVL